MRIKVKTVGTAWLIGTYTNLKFISLFFWIKVEYKFLYELNFKLCHNVTLIMD
ncbi:hypothetical protein BTHERMOSOX_1530 [Bathymodiolus thermophilus thioautotrophic gill symbiont]|nr:hypothetical protein BTHERMOSOX_1530 [Bathymodiolus thermophilus thioautotrophic gill symbiont]